MACTRMHRVCRLWRAGFILRSSNSSRKNKNQKAHTQKAHTMKFNKLGQTDIDVSLICLGTMTFGEQNTEAEAFEQMDHAHAAGVNFFDTAELYAVPPRAETYGRTEEIIGNWFQKT